MSTAQPPVFIPTLHEVIAPAVDASALASLDAEQRAAVQAEAVRQILAQVAPRLELYLQDALSDLVRRQSAALAHQIGEEIELVVRQCTDDVLQAVAALSHGPPAGAQAAGATGDPPPQSR